LPIVTHTPPNPHIAFRRAPPNGDRTTNLPKRQARAAAGVGRRECWVGCVVRLVCTAPPTPTRNPPWRGGRCAPPCRRIRAGLRPSGSRCRAWLGGFGELVLMAPLVAVPVPVTPISSNVAEWKRDVFVVFDSWFASGAVEHDGGGVDAGLHPAEVLLAQPDRRCAPHAGELLPADRLGGEYRACARTGSDFADDDQRASPSDDIQLQAAHPYVAAANFKTALLEQRGNERFAAARDVGFTGRRAAGRGRSSFLGSRRRPSRELRRR